MPVSTTIKVVGVKDTINALRKIDPQLQKDFKAQATQIAEPAISAGKAVYDTSAIVRHGITNGQEKGRSRANFPFTVS
jgi:hypothetical protein